jgi:hypothetical protein
MNMPRIHLDNDGIMRVEYASLDSISLSDIEYEYKQRISISGKNKQLILVNLGRVVNFDPEAQRFLVSKEMCDITKAVAIVFPASLNYSLLTKYFAEKFKSSKKSFPTEIFDNEDKAIVWLKQYK